MRLTEFWERMRAQFGATYADSLAKDQVLAQLGGRSVVEALEAGEPARRVQPARRVAAHRVPQRLRVPRRGIMRTGGASTSEGQLPPVIAPISSTGTKRNIRTRSAKKQNAPSPAQATIPRNTALPWHAAGNAPDGQKVARGHAAEIRASRAMQVGRQRVLLRFSVASVVTLVAGLLLEQSGERLADGFGLSGVVFGATVLAASTALPELSTGIASVP